MCRFDFLPSEPVNRESNDNVKWLLSEVEGHWCEGFFRAAPDSVCDKFLNSVLKRL